MRLRKKSLLGKIDQNGTLLASWDSLADFLAMHKGKNVIVRVEVQSVEPTEKTRNYYFGYILPTLQGVLYENGERYTKGELDLELRRKCPVCLEEERVNGEWKVRAKDFEELDQAEANEFIEFIFQYAAENYYTILESPK